MPETNEQARLRLFLAEYERVCKRYSLLVRDDTSYGKVYERYVKVLDNTDDLPRHMSHLKESGINA